MARATAVVLYWSSSIQRTNREDSVTYEPKGRYSKAGWRESFVYDNPNFVKNGAAIRSCALDGCRSKKTSNSDFART